ncbi:Ig-like domain-containing protein [Candidatus Binatia bacterium]|nr:Ig-like domain-containing protein [Candidatus Binatia bacterium]
MRSNWLFPIWGALAIGGFVQPWSPGLRAAQAATCVGDCSGDRTVTVDEILAMVNIALGRAAVSSCPAGNANGDTEITIDEILAAVNNALSGCESGANRAPTASDMSLSAGSSTPYVEKQLIGSDPDNDTITYELIADDSGPGYNFAYVNPQSGMLYLSLVAGFQGNIALPYRVTDGRLFSNTATVTVQAQVVTPSRETGSADIPPEVYARYPRGYYYGDLLGAPGEQPTLPSAVDLSRDFPLPGDQGQQGSCVGWATAYALKTYQERIEIGWSLEPLQHRFSPAYVYNQINGGKDEGSRITDALDLIVQQGVASLAKAPYDDQDFRTQPSNAARQEAAQFKGKAWKTANGTVEIKNALANRLPVVGGIVVFDALMNLRGGNSVYNTFTGAYQGGHAITFVGYDDGRYGGAFKIVNSWSQNWGDQGYFWMPYAAANQTVTAPYGQTTVLRYAYVLEDAENTVPPPPDPVDPPPPADLPNLEVSDWLATYDPTPRGAGELQWTVTNTGEGTAPGGAYVSLVVSDDTNFTPNDTYVVYESIPFELESGNSAYRDEENAIPFNFPDHLVPGEYYMAVWVDDRNAVLESNEDDNVSPGDSTIEISSDRPDMEVLSWYAQWDFAGDGGLIYEVVNNGEQVAPSGWWVTLALSPNDTIGDGDEIFLFGETADYDLDPDDVLYRDEFEPAAFSLYYDYSGTPVPAGEYYMALWLDPDDELAESNEINNASLSWGTIGLAGGADLQTGRSAGVTDAAEAAISPLEVGKAYNGKVLPPRRVAMRKVRIVQTPQGGRQVEFLDGGAAARVAPRVRSALTHMRSKVANARQKVIFPVQNARPMPSRYR